MAAIPYQINPGTQSGSGIFGSVPGPLSLPQPYNAFSHALPGAQTITSNASGDVLNELSGQLSPDTLATIQNEGAAFGIQTGMPGSGLVNNYDLNAAAQASMQQQQQGATNYKGVVTPTSRYLTINPSTEAELAEINALNAAAPNPTMAGLTNLGSYIGGLGFSYEMNQLGGNIGSPNQVSYSDFPTNSDTGLNFDPNAGGGAEGVDVPG